MNAEQTSIPKHKLTRAASLLGTGAKIGANYLKAKSKKLVTGKDHSSEFHETTANDSFKAFSKLKGGPLKMAQMLSIDKNILPKEYISEFSKAQYSAPPLSYPLVVKTFRQEFGRSPSELFDSFGKNAKAGASIGQVHQAKKGDQTFAVKVQYPGVGESVKSDLAIVKPLAMSLFQLNAKAVDPYLKEVEERLLEETNYKLELQRSQKLAQECRHVDGIAFPSYYPELSSKRIITMDWIDGIHLDQFAKSDAPQEERNLIGQALWDFYHHQIHALKIFHADPHHGNFLVKGSKLWIIDFGCVKELPDSFYRQYFDLMDVRRTSSDADFDHMLSDLRLLRPDDSHQIIESLRPVFRESIELLGRPFQQEIFDFGDPEFLDEIAAFGERTRNNPELKAINQGRGNPHALYLNRTFFGLYNLCGTLKAQVKCHMPPQFQSPQAHTT